MLEAADLSQTDTQLIVFRNQNKRLSCLWGHPLKGKSRKKHLSWQKTFLFFCLHNQIKFFPIKSTAQKFLWIVENFYPTGAKCSSTHSYQCIKGCSASVYFQLKIRISRINAVFCYQEKHHSHNK